MIYRERSWKATRKKSKYANVPDDYQGQKYHSRFEAKYARDLDIRRRAGEIVSWERQVRIDLRAYGSHICNYFVDFLVHYPDGTREYVEVKGFATEVWRLKWKLFLAQMAETEPDAKLTVVK
jgi:hypothetical protein